MFGYVNIRTKTFALNVLTVPPPKRVLRIIGLAGAIANMFEDNDFPYNLDECIEVLESDSSFSDSDRKLTGKYTKNDVRSTIEMVRGEWLRIKHRAEIYYRYLIERDSLTSPRI